MAELPPHVCTRLAGVPSASSPTLVIESLHSAIFLRRFSKYLMLVVLVLPLVQQFSCTLPPWTHGIEFAHAMESERIGVVAWLFFADGLRS